MTIISNCTASIIKDAALALKEGHLVAFPTETVYGLGADATNEKSVARIYEVKGRPTDHPLIVHISSINNLDKWAKDIPEYAIKLARAFWPGPMTLVLKRTDLAKDFITGGQDSVAIRVPSNTLANQLLREFESLGGNGMAAPSANRFGKVSPTTAEAVQEELSPYLSPDDLILDGGYCQIGIESTIIDCTHELPQILRPGGITQEQIESIIELNSNPENNNRINKIKVPGLLDSHYCPKAKVLLSGRPQPGDGFIALANVQSPLGSIRLASPKDNEEFARQLYGALRLADHKNIEKIFVLAAEGNGIAIAINERLEKASMPSKDIIKK
jgi:L-threonylcarbamoyladenylate synthase